MLKEISEQADLSEQWAKVFVQTPYIVTKFKKEDPVQKAMLNFAETMGIPVEGNVLSDNFNRWGRTLSGYIHEKCGEKEKGHLGKDEEEQRNVDTERKWGSAPAVVLQKVMKPRGGDLRKLVLPGGGNLCLRMWAGVRRFFISLIGWYKNGSTHTPAFEQHQELIEDFLDKKHHFHVHAWQLLEEREAAHMYAEMLFVLIDIALNETVKAEKLMKLFERTVNKARKKGKDKLAAQRANHLAQCLSGGAGQAHKMANADNLLPPLRLVLETKDKGNKQFVNKPLEVAKHYAEPWRGQ